ncbi:hypothetical protein HOG21_03580 [bacterium]|jgi:hypothetical protein|nr:hypothetical protein [bacterium]
MYTLDDLEKARADFAKWDDKFSEYTGNNPSKYDSQIKAALRKIRTIETVLKNGGALARTAQEELDYELDRLFPDAKSKSIHEKDGKKYQIIYFPIEKSNSGKTVTEWGHRWKDIT